jgi:hypothetical protein
MTSNTVTIDTSSLDLDSHDIIVNLGDSMSTGTTYTLGAALPGAIRIDDITGSSGGSRHRFPNKKMSLNIYEAHGGYVVEIDKDTYGADRDIYVISDTTDFDHELGKIITHHTLKS